mmetsp:Transcript_80420/g.209787  ORF Transcript_80420/g.209787 Transcript_80420/m.209787 type:complete len:233 (-) Transcript_80420:1225-1923(-)
MRAPAARPGRRDAARRRGAAPEAGTDSNSGEPRIESADPSSAPPIPPPTGPTCAGRRDRWARRPTSSTAPAGPAHAAPPRGPSAPPPGRASRRPPASGWRRPPSSQPPRPWPPPPGRPRREPRAWPPPPRPGPPTSRPAPFSPPAPAAPSAVSPPSRPWRPPRPSSSSPPRSSSSSPRAPSASSLRASFVPSRPSCDSTLLRASPASARAWSCAPSQRTPSGACRRSPWRPW